MTAEQHEMHEVGGASSAGKQPEINAETCRRPRYCRAQRYNVVNRSVSVQDQPLVSKRSFIGTALGLLFYAGDMVTDIITATLYGYSGDWKLCVWTLGIMYLAVLINSFRKWQDDGYVRCTGPIATIRYLVSLLFNWPDLRQCWALLRVEWELTRSPRRSANLVPVWQQSRLRVTWLKLMEGVFEACPQALLQLVLLLPDLECDTTRHKVSVYFRMVSTALSLCSAATAPVHLEKRNRYDGRTVLPPVEVAVLLVWMVPVTVCRLLCLALLLYVHLLWGLACMALHLTLYWVYWSGAEGVPRTLDNWFGICLSSAVFLVSPFDNSVTSHSRAVRHTILVLNNIAAVVVVMVYGQYPLLYYPYSVLYPAVSVVGLLLIGLLNWMIHQIYWQLSATSVCN